MALRIKGARSPLKTTEGIRSKIVKRSRGLSQKFKDRPKAHALLPNMATILALCVGLSAVRFAILGQWEFAAACTFIAAILDAMDGRLARYLGASSRFGAELDSFSDFVSFGVAPALMMYFFALNEWGAQGWAVSLFFAICSALRLARFNTHSIEGVASHPGYFVGVPAPSAALLSIWPLVAFLQWQTPLLKHPVVVGAVMVVVGILMISNLRTFSMKNVHIPSQWQKIALLCVALVASALFTAPWLVLQLIGIVYVALIPISIRRYKTAINTTVNKD